MVKGWKNSTLGEIAKFTGGSQPPLSTFISHKADGYVRLVQIRDYKTDKYATYVPIDLTRRFCSKEDIMIGRYGPPIFQILKGIDGAYNVALFKAEPVNVDKTFLWYTLKRDDLFAYVELLSRRSSGQTGIDLVHLREWEFILPESVEEQKEIATALSEVDEYIAALEKLIAKKKAVKVGAMQELLTGKRRLEGFTDEWEDKTLEDILKLQKGEQKNVATLSETGSYPVMNGGLAASGYSEEYNRDKNTITISEGGNSCGFVNFMNCSFWAGGHCYTIHDIKIDLMFLYHLLKANESKIMALRIGSGLPNVQKKNLYEMAVKIPSTRNEQLVIAKVLFDMDTEIEALVAKLNKARVIKIGMMQQLLTGNIRLPFEASKSKVQAKGHTKEFGDAIVIAAIVDALGRSKYALGRTKITKLLYLYERKRNADVSRFREKAAGPYNPAVRYSGGEQIAIKNKYISVETSKGKGSKFICGSRIDDIHSYINKWGIRSDVEWLTGGFKFWSVDELEVLATIDNARLKLEEKGKPVTVATVKDYITNSSEWNPKLARPVFADDVIETAIIESFRLFPTGGANG